MVRLVERAGDAGLLGTHSVDDVTLMWDATCTGLAMREICGPIEGSQAEQIWLDTLTALLGGLTAEAHTQTTVRGGQN